MSGCSSLAQIACLALAIASFANGGQGSIEEALRRSRIQGGLCAVVGPAGARLAESVARQGAFLAHHLSPDPSEVEAARRALLRAGLGGRASAEAWRGPLLPYADSLVSLLIVAQGERVYALTDDGQLKALDAANGRPAKVYENAGTPSVILLADDGQSKLGTLVLAGNESVRALDAESGRLLWKQGAAQPHNVLASRDTDFYIEGDDRRGATQGDISARELLTGKLLWKTTHYWARRTEQAAFGCDRIAYEMRAPHNWREFYEKHPEEKEQDRYAFAVISAKTGEEIQKVYRTATSARHGEFRAAFWHKGHLLTEAITREGLSLVLFKPDDFATPAIQFKANYAGDRGFGHCYPPVLTDRFYINGQLHVTDLETHKQAANPIGRGACNTARSGYLPGNGMIYMPPCHCICFPMLEGNLCLVVRTNL